jgi:gamma-glutamylcysteine synthetase
MTLLMPLIDFVVVDVIEFFMWCNPDVQELDCFAATNVLDDKRIIATAAIRFIRKSLRRVAVEKRRDGIRFSINCRYCYLAASFCT